MSAPLSSAASSCDHAKRQSWSAGSISKKGHSSELRPCMAQSESMDAGAPVVCTDCSVYSQEHMVAVPEPVRGA